MSVAISQPCGISNGATDDDGVLLVDRWRGWTPAERASFVDGVAALGWVPAGAVDLESPAYPGFVAMPGNPCHAGMVAPDTFGGRAPDRFALLDGIPAARGVVESLLDMLRRAVELARRGVGAVGDALRRALDALAGILGTGFGVLSLALVAVLVVAGVVLISADRRR